jgi:molybdate transport system substrate-binding protein
MRPRLRRWSCALFAAAGLHLAPAWAQPSPEPPLLVYAAASLTDVLGELSAAWQRRPDIAIRSSFASSAVLARQIEAGGRADVFIAADQEWMDYLQARGLVDPATRRDVAGNRLVLIAPAASPLRLRIAPRFDLAGALAGGRLSTADPDTVPAGRYARAALASLGVWHQVETRLARADNVRGALMFVRIVDLCPADPHAPCAYPAAALAGARREAADYVQFLAGAEARAIWKKHGFTEIE